MNLAQQLEFRWARRANNEIPVERNRLHVRQLWSYRIMSFRISRGLIVLFFLK